MPEPSIKIIKKDERTEKIVNDSHRRHAIGLMHSLAESFPDIFLQIADEMRNKTDAAKVNGYSIG